MRHQDLFSGLIRLHILHHACAKPVYGLWIIEELGRHGYRLSPGTLYPLLHTLEKRGLLRSKAQRAGGRLRRLYRATPRGRQTLRGARQKVLELFGELFERELHSVLGGFEKTPRQRARPRTARRASFPADRRAPRPSARSSDRW
jgi:DNA-binding PadR family transcriptional regulator